ncbi:MAG: hypothetical protein PHR68_04135 [Candidatus Gracilibacteria bacterium]|nr:hypothetical protein [Candidatus Gracilibacteria bacterium]
MKKKIISGVLVVGMLATNFINFANATVGSINFNYSNYNGDQKLQVSGVVDAQIDRKLSKIEDYYSQFKLLKDLATQTLSKKNATKSVKDKNKYAELINYYSAKADLIYKLSTLTNKDDVTKLKNTFKIAVKSKDTTLNKVISKVNSVGKVEITNDNNNFNELSSSDFAKETEKMIEDTYVNPYTSYSDVKKNAKIIQTADDFKNIKQILPDNVRFKDEYGNSIKGGISYTKSFLGLNNGYYFSNTTFNNKVNSILSKLQTLNSNNISGLNFTGLNYLYDVFRDNKLVYNFLHKINLNSQLNNKLLIKSVGEIRNTENKLIGYNLFIDYDYKTKGILKYGNIYNVFPALSVIYQEGGDYDVYINTAPIDFIYMGENKNGNNIYLFINPRDKILSFSEVDTYAENKYYDAKGNINIVFEDGSKINNLNSTYDLDTFIKIINKKITKININGENITSGLLIDKGSIINLYK